MPGTRKRTWITRTVVGVILATFFSDVSHEMATAVLPLYLVSMGFGPASLGVIEGIADFLVSLSKLAGGAVGHHVRAKRPWASLGYLVTTAGTAGLGLVHTTAGFLSLRSAAWVGRGFRGPLRDHILADAVEPTHYGRAYGLERAGDMLGAVIGPLIAALLVWASLDLRSVILWTLLPGLVAAGSMFFLAREPRARELDPHGQAPRIRPRFPTRFWLFTGAVLLFGLGDFSRTFLIWLAASALGEHQMGGGALSIAVLLYVLHNAVAAGSAYPVGHLSDQRPKVQVLAVGYALGALTNALLAATSSSIGWLVVAIALSGVYISEPAASSRVGHERRRLLRRARHAAVNFVLGIRRAGHGASSRQGSWSPAPGAPPPSVRPGRPARFSRGEVAETGYSRPAGQLLGVKSAVDERVGHAGEPAGPAARDPLSLPFPGAYAMRPRSPRPQLGGARVVKGFMTSAVSAAGTRRPTRGQAEAGASTGACALMFLR